MLIIMLVVFLVTELPQGFLAFLNGLYTGDVNTYIYRNVGELLDFLSLVNCRFTFLSFSKLKLEISVWTSCSTAS